jgi:hypothetical protein
MLFWLAKAGKVRQGGLANEKGGRYGIAGWLDLAGVDVVGVDIVESKSFLRIDLVLWQDQWLAIVDRVRQGFR